MTIELRIDEGWTDEYKEKVKIRSEELHKNTIKTYGRYTFDDAWEMWTHTTGLDHDCWRAIALGMVREKAWKRGL